MICGHSCGLMGGSLGGDMLKSLRIEIIWYVEEISSAAMLVAKRSAGIAV